MVIFKLIPIARFPYFERPTCRATFEAIVLGVTMFPHAPTFTRPMLFHISQLLGRGLERMG
jgi:hypothetical protein